MTVVSNLSSYWQLCANDIHLGTLQNSGSNNIYKYLAKNEDKTAYPKLEKEKLLAQSSEHIIAKEGDYLSPLERKKDLAFNKKLAAESPLKLLAFRLCDPISIGSAFWWAVLCQLKGIAAGVDKDRDMHGRVNAFYHVFWIKVLTILLADGRHVLPYI